jgi:hypothetical protein
MANTPQSEAYHVRTFTGSANRTIGTFFKAGFDAPSLIRGHYIFYRLVKTDHDLFMERDNTNGFSKPVFVKVKADGATYMVTHSKESNRMVIAHANDFTTEQNYGQGLQVRAAGEHCTVIDGVAKLIFPTAIPTIEIRDEEAKAATPKAVQAPLPMQNTPKGTYQRCGCYYIKGQIEKPCLVHEPLWKPVIENRRASL